MIRAVLLAALAAAFGAEARAQTTNAGSGRQPSVQQNVTEPGSGTQPGPQTEPPAAPTEHLFGTWGGVRTYLGDLGIDVLADYTTESAGNVTGGRRKGFDYAHQIAVQVDADLEKLAGARGLSVHGVVVQRAGRNASTDYIGDNLLQVQEIYGGGGDVLAHLVYLYAEQKFAGGRIDIAAGRLPILSDFAANPLYCDFMSVGLCGNPHAYPGSGGGFTAWPVSTWGGRVRVKPTADTYIQAGAYEANPDYGGRAGFSWFTGNSTGTVVPVEAAWTPAFGADKLPGHYKVGFAYDSSHTNDLLDSRKRHAGTTIGYVLADQMLWRRGPAFDDGLIALGGYFHNDGSVATFQDYAFGGLLLRGPLSFRPKDTLGALFIYAHLSSRQARGQQALLDAGELLPAGVYGPQKHEEIVEVNYNIHAFRAVDIEPDIQYVIRPGGTNRTPDALVLGLKTHVTF